MQETSMQCFHCKSPVVVTSQRQPTSVSSSLSSQKPNGVITFDDEMRNNIPIVCKRERAMTERDIEARSYYYVWTLHGCRQSSRTFQKGRSLVGELSLCIYVRNYKLIVVNLFIFFFPPVSKTNSFSSIRQRGFFSWVPRTFHSWPERE